MTCKLYESGHKATHQKYEMEWGQKTFQKGTLSQTLYPCFSWRGFGIEGGGLSSRPKNQVSHSTSAQLQTLFEKLLSKLGHIVEQTFLALNLKGYNLKCFTYFIR